LLWRKLGTAQEEKQSPEKTTAASQDDIELFVRFLTIRIPLSLSFIHGHFAGGVITIRASLHAGGEKGPIDRP
jgi:hypothetical protein